MTVKDTVLRIAREVMPLPTAPFREARVRDTILDFCKRRGIRTRVDDMGNVIATLNRGSHNPVLAFGAHMDHPGFIIERDSVRGRTTALFYGGVEEEYFAGTAVRVFTDTNEVTGRVTKTRFDLKRNLKRAWLSLDGDVKRGDVAMWDLAALRVRGDRLRARACDDLAGCVSVLALLDELVRRRSRMKVIGFFTVAEEGGLNGAKYLAMNGGLAKSSHIVAIETSRETPVARIGRGAVIRVGDRQRVFHAGLTRFMEDAARRLSRTDKDFRMQRALMDGGTCETSVYQRFGYIAAAACVPLGNYHNRDFRTKRIAAECVSVSDLVNMVRLFVEMAKRSDDLGVFVREKPPVYREERRDLGERLFH